MSSKAGEDSSLKNRKKGKDKDKSPKKEKDTVKETKEDSTPIEAKEKKQDSVATTAQANQSNATTTETAPVKFDFASLFESRGPGKGDVWSDIILLLFFYFAVIHVSAALVNHIDDTDETYGYWEPLHYLLYNEGMQTWEYSPQYAIRSYAFIYPLYLLGKAVQTIGLHKIRMFYLIRLTLGLFTAGAEVNFINAISRRYSNLILTFFVTFFIICSPGIYFSSTSFLPSAVASSLIMHCVACWIQMKFHWAIFWGSLAVLWTGWPFVGLLLLPIGTHMIISIIMKHQKRNPAVSYAITAVVQFVVTSLMVVAFVFLPSLIVDVQSYGKWTSPTLNIAMYNVFNGSGDNLYGIEPVTYYIKNLFLNLGFAWPAALAWPVIVIINKLLHKKDSTTKIELLDGFSITILFTAVLWLGVLFSRPHKEERFMYPVYPLLCFIGALSVVHTADILSRFAVKVLRVNEKRPDGLKQLTFFTASLTLLATLSLFLSRTSANYRNYAGYLKLWQDAGLFLEFDPSVPRDRQQIVCVGGEWHLFPSHFFLPKNVKLEYIEDGFKGILPQHYATEHGTFREPLQPFNDRNEEEKSRYVDLTQCDYFIGSTLPQEAIAAKEKEQPPTIVKFDTVFSKPIVAGTKEGWSIGKAYYLPIDPKELDILIWKEYSFYKVATATADPIRHSESVSPPQQK